MPAWLQVLGPAVVIALAIRIDARRIGPYFALSSVISASEGWDATFWYEDSDRRRALLRRLLYPCIAGFILAWMSYSWADVAATGGLAASLLIWPAIIGGLPWFVPRRTWHLPTLYVSYITVSAVSAVAGRALQQAIVEYSDGDVLGWAGEQAATNGVVWIALVFAGSIFKISFRRTNAEAREREKQGAEPR